LFVVNLSTDSPIDLDSFDVCVLKDGEVKKTAKEEKGKEFLQRKKKKKKKNMRKKEWNEGGKAENGGGGWEQGYG
jgi:hypothetical protein